MRGLGPAISSLPGLAERADTKAGSRVYTRLGRGGPCGQVTLRLVLAPSDRCD